MHLTKNTLSSIELNVIDICNRTCGFCPRGVGFQNTKNQMSHTTIDSIADSLRNIDYRGTITLAGFGEPLLHKKLKNYVQTLKNSVQLKQIKLITNGDYLDESMAANLIHAGVNCIKVSMYDKDMTEHFESFLQQYDIERIYKHYYNGLPAEVEVNRNEMWKEAKPKRVNRACYLPFYKLFINWDGRVGLCSNDWNVSQHFGNVNHKPIHEIWESSYLNSYRDMLAANRRTASPCLSCNINGQVLGKESFEYYTNNA